MSDQQKSLKIARWRLSAVENSEDYVAVEEPLEIRVGFPAESGREEKTIAITMRTPGNDEELAVGFLLSEGLIHSPSEVINVWHRSPPAPGTSVRNVVRVELHENHSYDFSKLERHFYTTSSCGVCGKTSLDALRTESQYSGNIVASQWRISDRLLRQIPDKLKKRQSVFEATGGLHGAGMFDSHGELSIVKEDVGRHNALDKLLGELFFNGQLPASQCGVIVSGRASFELVQKIVMAGVPMIVAIGAPSTLAVQVAQEFGVTLIGFLRDNGFNVYAAEHRIS